MKTEYSLPDQQQQLLAHALDSAIRLNQQLNALLDLYDFYVDRYPPGTAGEELELQDLYVSIKALGELPYHVGMALKAWRSGAEPLLSKTGFQVHVLNEIELHMRALSSFFHRKHLDMDGYSDVLTRDALRTIQAANTVFGTWMTAEKRSKS